MKAPQTETLSRLQKLISFAERDLRLAVRQGYHGRFQADSDRVRLANLRTRLATLEARLRDRVGAGRRKGVEDGKG